MITFNAENHTYLLDGIPIPSVTTILKEVGLIDFSKVPQRILEASQLFGTAVHKACELYDVKNLDEDILDPHLKPYLKGWKKFLKDTAFVITAVEEKVASKKYWYAGRLDRRGYLDKHTVLDIKTGVDHGVATPIQLIGYENAYNENHKDKIKQRISVLLNDKGTYKLEPYTNKGDFSVFVAALTVRNWRNNNAKHN